MSSSLSKIFFTTDVTPAAVMISIFDESSAVTRKLLQGLKPGARIVSHSHTMGAWKAGCLTLRVEGHSIYLFTVLRMSPEIGFGLAWEKNPTRLSIIKFQEAQGMIPGKENKAFAQVHS